MSEESDQTPDISLLIDGRLEPSQLNFRPYNRLIEDAVEILPGLDLSENQIDNVIDNFDRYRVFIEGLRVRKGWVRRKLIRLSADGAFFVAGFIGTSVAVPPLGLLGWAAMAGATISLSYDAGGIARAYTIQDRIMKTLEQIDRIMDFYA